MAPPLWMLMSLIADLALKHPFDRLTRACGDGHVRSSSARRHNPCAEVVERNPNHCPFGAGVPSHQQPQFRTMALQCMIRSWMISPQKTIVQRKALYLQSKKLSRCRLGGFGSAMRGAHQKEPACQASACHGSLARL